MRFDGEVWFDFSTPSVWVFYRWVRALAESGVSVNLSWIPRHTPDEQVAMATFLGLQSHAARGRYIHAMLGLIHIERESPADEETVIRALVATGCGAEELMEDHSDLVDLRERAERLGVGAVPTLYRHGPVLSVQLNPAVLDGDPRAVARVINDMIVNDGIWELRKP